MTRLQELLDQGIIDEVYNQLKTGKEAEVWLVSHKGEAVAAKLYKAREFRSFKNDSGYLEGRTVRNSRTQRAMEKGSKFGKEASEEAWKSAEADALFSLHAAGVRVPKPVLFFDGVLLMEAIGDAEGRVAPRLIDAGITREEAGPLYLQVRADVIKMLSLDLIHGDLSPFNVLMAKTGPVIIDFPQVVTAAKNSQSEQFFRRDLGNIHTFFVGLDPALSRYEGDADEIWRAYVRRDLSAGFVPSGRVSAQGRGGGQNRQGPPGRANGAPGNAGRPQGRGNTGGRITGAAPSGPGGEPSLGRASDGRGPQGNAGNGPRNGDRPRGGQGAGGTANRQDSGLRQQAGSESGRAQGSGSRRPEASAGNDARGGNGGRQQATDSASNAGSTGGRQHAHDASSGTGGRRHANDASSGEGGRQTGTDVTSGTGGRQGSAASSGNGGRPPGNEDSAGNDRRNGGRRRGNGRGNRGPQQETGAGSGNGRPQQGNGETSAGAERANGGRPRGDGRSAGGSPQAAASGTDRSNGGSPRGDGGNGRNSGGTPRSDSDNGRNSSSAPRGDGGNARNNGGRQQGAEASTSTGGRPDNGGRPQGQGQRGASQKPPQRTGPQVAFKSTPGGAPAIAQPGPKRHQPPARGRFHGS